MQPWWAYKIKTLKKLSLTVKVFRYRNVCIRHVNYNLCWTMFTCRLASLPEKPASIDWSYYRTAVVKAGMVDEFEKKVRSSDFSLTPSLLLQRVLCSLSTRLSVSSSLRWRSLSQWTLRLRRLIPRSRILWVSLHTSVFLLSRRCFRRSDAAPGGPALQWTFLSPNAN